MITHIGMLTLIETAGERHVAAISEGLLSLAALIPGLQKVTFGKDIGLNSTNASLIFQLTFDSEESWREYATHPAHKAVISELIAPVLKSKMFVQVADFVEASP